jgi:FkbM family methyltransferase
LTKQHHRELLPVLSRYIPKKGVVMDVGAHAGQFTKLFSGMVPAGHVYAFEPGEYALSILRKVQTLRSLKNVTIVPLGLGDQPTEAVLSIPIKKSGSLGFGLSSLGSVNDVRNVQKDTVFLQPWIFFALRKIRSG